MMSQLATEALAWNSPRVLAKVIWVPCTYAIFLIQTVIKSVAFIGLAKSKASPGP
jgi:hypothetical protein